MSGENIVVRWRRSDRRLVRLHADGREKLLPIPEHPPSLTEEEINAAALSDPDNPPLTPEREAKLKRVPQVNVMRRTLRLTQEEFAARFRIPLGTLRDWEQGKTEPDQAARAYLTVIARNPDAVTEALSRRT